MGQGITKEWLDGFLKEGAFLRLSYDQFWLQRGPFKKFESNPSSKKDPEFSMGYMNFFDSQVSLMASPEGPLILSRSELQRALESWLPKEIEKMTRSDFVAPHLEQFEKSLQIILGKIQREEIEKAVPMALAVSDRSPTPEDRGAWLLSLTSAPHALYPFGFWTGLQGFMGATPELLFHRINGLIKTMALAGTCPKSEMGTRKPLLKDPKELHEHNLVIEDLKKQLSKFGWVKVGETKVLELPTLLHLMTELQVEGSPHLVTELVTKLHPTPALGVAPRNYGFQWLKDLPDQQDRGLLGGPVVFRLSDQEALCLVAIRTMQWGPGGSKIGAGCGIVKGSQVEREWQEVLQKLNSIYLMLGL